VERVYAMGSGERASGLIDRDQPSERKKTCYDLCYSARSLQRSGGGALCLRVAEALFTTMMTATCLQPDVNAFLFFCAVAANHSAGIGMGVVDELWPHCLLLFSRVSVN